MCDHFQRGTTCTASEFDGQWLRDHAYGAEPLVYPTNHRQQTLRGKHLWEGASLQLPRRAFADAMDDIKPVMEDLHKYGLAIVHSTPSSMDETEKFSRKIGFVLETIYGTMWTTNPQSEEQQYNDTASTNLELLHHTDGTYMRDPPGLQIFNCIAQAGEGGASRYVDSFHVVETLRREHPAAFDFFATTPLHYFTYDNDAHLATMEPLIRLDHAGNIVQFRHNDYDRAPLTHLSFDQVDQFYRYHEELLRIMRDPKMEFRVKLQVGDMILVDNQRVMHGRDAFDGGDRALIGCYIGRNEYESRLRVLGII
jgi:trimethyllysine dioxygenase